MECDEHNQDKGETKRRTRGRESRMTRDRRTDGEMEETEPTPKQHRGDVVSRTNR